MPKLPFPEKPESILASVILTIVSFMLYYTVGFRYLLGTYESQFQEVMFSGPACESLVTKVRFPQWVSVNGLQWVYFNVTNESGESVKEVEVQFILPSNQPSGILLPSYYPENVFDDTVKVDSLHSKAVLSGRQLIFTKSSFKLDDVKMRLSCGQASSLRVSEGAKKITQDSLGSFIHSLLENVLLPPLANGVVPTLAFFSCWLIENFFKRGLKK